MLKPPVVRESQLLATAVKRLKALTHADPALIFRKRHGSPLGVAGDPDIYLLWHGVHAEIELKRPGESPTLLQLARLEQWSRAGAQCFVIHSLDELDLALKTIKTGAPPSE